MIPSYDHDMSELGPDRPQDAGPTRDYSKLRIAQLVGGGWGWIPIEDCLPGPAYWYQNPEAMHDER
jgi:hypothetical protein